jgi:hypothetical protein
MRICCLKVRHSAIRTLFQSLSSHGHKLTLPMWKRCLWNLVFPLVDTVRHLASTSSKDQWHGKELGTEGGKPVHMLVHHRYISLLIQHQLLNFLMGDFSPRIQKLDFSWIAKHLCRSMPFFGLELKIPVNSLNVKCLIVKLFTIS